MYVIYRERSTVNHNLRDRENHISERLLSSHRKAMFMGSVKEVSGHHRLYKHPEEKFSELPYTLQVIYKYTFCINIFVLIYLYNYYR